MTTHEKKSIITYGCFWLQTSVICAVTLFMSPVFAESEESFFVTDTAETVDTILAAADDLIGDSDVNADDDSSDDADTAVDADDDSSDADTNATESDSASSDAAFDDATDEIELETLISEIEAEEDVSPSTEADEASADATANTDSSDNVASATN